MATADAPRALIDQVRVAYERGDPLRAIYTQLYLPAYPGRSFQAFQSALRGWIHAEGWRKRPRGRPRGSVADRAARLAVEAGVAAIDDRQRQQAERQLLEQLRKEEARFRRLLETITQVAATLPRQRILPAPPPPPPPGTGEERAIVLALSDVQAGIVVHAREVGARLAYDSTQLEERWRTWERGVLQLIDEQRAIGPVVAIAIAGVGDFVENHQLRDAARKRTDLDLTAATFAVEALLAGTIRTLRARYNVPVSVDLVPGNHDRIGGGRPGTELTCENWVVIIGWLLEREFADDPDVSIHTHLTEYALLEFGASTVFLHHGHGIQGTALLPWYGIDRRVTRWEGWARSFFRYVLLGHFHNYASWQTASGCQVYVNGAWFHTTAYGTGLGLASDAQQLALVLTPSEGVVYTRQILLAGRIGPEPAQPRVWPRPDAP